MGLTHKADWEKTKERLRQWWNHEYFGRCALAVYAPRDQPPKSSGRAEPPACWQTGDDPARPGV